ncbi:hypothetical protein ACFFSW_03930 [Saccharothrix longispora]|uniref:Uncharacterized protein n=1 Tax=Saccharothrix longispora TaxID=33920 RepID=A0ABU1PNB0_9PSEU|nr:hypothetical protein [Saccharothrix longispora]MDR6592113.1 hypothetical protein [Saccharothrix longispora]
MRHGPVPRLIAIAARRPVVVASVEGDVEGTYRALLAALTPARP